MPARTPSKPPFVELNDGTQIPILFENRSVLAIDKPAGWMLVPFNWQKTNRNLHAAIVAAIASGGYWARSRGLKFLCHVHRLDADTTGILLLAKSRGALDTISDLFESRKVAKRYLAVVRGVPAKERWTCELPLSPDPDRIGRVQVDPKSGKDAETHFALLATKEGRSLIEARPLTGRTHQIRVHLAHAGLVIVGDPLYARGSHLPPDRDRPAPDRPGPARPPADAHRLPPRRAAAPGPEPSLALRAIELAYRDPFTKAQVRIHAPFEAFVRAHGFAPGSVPP